MKLRAMSYDFTLHGHSRLPVRQGWEWRVTGHGRFKRRRSAYLEVNSTQKDVHTLNQYGMLVLVRCINLCKRSF